MNITNRQIHIYDEFAGMPEPPDWSLPLQNNNIVKKCVSIFPFVKRIISKVGTYPEDKITYHTEPQNIHNVSEKPANIALLNINTYTYDKTLQSILSFSSRMNDKGFVQVNKYGWWKPCTQAVNRYLGSEKFITHKLEPCGIWWQISISNEKSVNQNQIMSVTTHSQLFKKVVVWGYPLHTHSHSYIHAAWVKAFKYMGYDTYWFSDESYDKTFDYTNCLFITEGYADRNIPLHETNIYYIHVCVDPKKYMDKNLRFFDMRLNKRHNNDANYIYNLEEKINQGKALEISSVVYYEELDYYPAIYISWATDLLPHEFDYSLQHETDPNCVYFVGTGVPQTPELKYALNRRNIEFVHIDCWNTPVSFEECMERMKRSVVNIDIRSEFHKDLGYIPCRIFKAISYGKIGITNSRRVQQLFGENNIIYHDDIDTLVELSLKNKNNKELLYRQMKYVEKYHTYLNRVNDLIKCAELMFGHN